jgi:uncharacterized membrane protein
MSPFVLWPCVAGAVILLAGIFTARRDLRMLAFTCYAAPLAVFGAEHLVIGSRMAGTVPAWMPFPIFWVYFVGVALIAASISLTVRKYVPLTLALLAVMFFLFVAAIHIPNVVARVHQRLFWTLAFRDAVFGAGVLALFGAETTRRPLIHAGRLLIAAALVFFGVEMCLYPLFAPGVPLGKLTPAWVPLPMLWAYASGAILIVCGIALLANRYARRASNATGVLMVVLTLCLYLPILIMARGTPALLDGVNYVFDTLLCGGAIFLLARALPAR